MQDALKEQFKKYDLTGKTWATLTRSTDEAPGEAAPAATEGPHWSDFGAQRYQQLVPSFTVMFPFFLAMVVGWVFVTERRQGTLKRLRFAPVSRAQILAGKLLPCFVLSMGLAAFLLLAGRLIFQMNWGPASWPLWEQVGWLLPVVTATSFASMGLALLVAAVSRSEIQVALFGALPVLVMALVSGCILPREMMTPSAQALSWFTPHGWALAAYRELLGDDPRYVPDLWVVAQVVRRADGLRGGLPGAGVVAVAAGLGGRAGVSSMKIKRFLFPAVLLASLAGIWLLLFAAASWYVPRAGELFSHRGRPLPWRRRDATAARHKGRPQSV